MKYQGRNMGASTGPSNSTSFAKRYLAAINTSSTNGNKPRSPMDASDLTHETQKRQRPPYAANVSSRCTTPPPPPPHPPLSNNDSKGGDLGLRQTMPMQSRCGPNSPSSSRMSRSSRENARDSVASSLSSTERDQAAYNANINASHNYLQVAKKPYHRKDDTIIPPNSKAKNSVLSQRKEIHFNEKKGEKVTDEGSLPNAEDRQRNQKLRSANAKLNSTSTESNGNTAKDTQKNTLLPVNKGRAPEGDHVSNPVSGLAQLENKKWTQKGWRDFRQSQYQHMYKEKEMNEAKDNEYPEPEMTEVSDTCTPTEVMTNRKSDFKSKWLSRRANRGNIQIDGDYSAEDNDCANNTYGGNTQRCEDCLHDPQNQHGTGFNSASNIVTGDGNVTCKNQFSIRKERSDGHWIANGESIKSYGNEMKGQQKVSQIIETEFNKQHYSAQVSSSFTNTSSTQVETGESDSLSSKAENESIHNRDCDGRVGIVSSSRYRLGTNPNFSKNAKEPDCGESENDHNSFLNRTKPLHCMVQTSIPKEERQIDNYDDANNNGSETTDSSSKLLGPQHRNLNGSNTGNNPLPQMKPPKKKFGSDPPPWMVRSSFSKNDTAPVKKGIRRDSSEPQILLKDKSLNGNDNSATKRQLGHLGRSSRSPPWLKSHHSAADTVHDDTIEPNGQQLDLQQLPKLQVVRNFPKENNEVLMKSAHGTTLKSLPVTSPEERSLDGYERTGDIDEIASGKSAPWLRGNKSKNKHIETMQKSNIKDNEAHIKPLQKDPTSFIGKKCTNGAYIDDISSLKVGLVDHSSIQRKSMQRTSLKTINSSTADNRVDENSEFVTTNMLPQHLQETSRNSTVSGDAVSSLISKVNAESAVNIKAGVPSKESELAYSKHMQSNDSRDAKNQLKSGAHLKNKVTLPPQLPFSEEEHKNVEASSGSIKRAKDRLQFVDRNREFVTEEFKEEEESLVLSSSNTDGGTKSSSHFGSVKDKINAFGNRSHNAPYKLLRNENTLPQGQPSTSRSYSVPNRSESKISEMSQNQLFDTKSVTETVKKPLTVDIDREEGLSNNNGEIDSHRDDGPTLSPRFGSVKDKINAFGNRSYNTPRNLSRREQPQLQGKTITSTLHSTSLRDEVEKLEEPQNLDLDNDPIIKTVREPSSTGLKYEEKLDKDATETDSNRDCELKAPTRFASVKDRINAFGNGSYLPRKEKSLSQRQPIKPIQHTHLNENGQISLTEPLQTTTKRKSGIDQVSGKIDPHLFEKNISTSTLEIKNQTATGDSIDKISFQASTKLSQFVQSRDVPIKQKPLSRNDCTKVVNEAEDDNRTLPSLGVRSILSRFEPQSSPPASPMKPSQAKGSYGLKRAENGRTIEKSEEEESKDNVMAVSSSFRSSDNRLHIESNSVNETVTSNGEALPSTGVKRIVSKFQYNGRTKSTYNKDKPNDFKSNPPDSNSISKNALKNRTHLPHSLHQSTCPRTEQLDQPNENNRMGNRNEGNTKYTSSGVSSIRSKFEMTQSLSHGVPMSPNDSGNERVLDKDGTSVSERQSGSSVSVRESGSSVSEREIENVEGRHTLELNESNNFHQANERFQLDHSVNRTKTTANHAVRNSLKSRVNFFQGQKSESKQQENLIQNLQETNLSHNDLIRNYADHTLASNDRLLNETKQTEAMALNSKTSSIVNRNGYSHCDHDPIRIETTPDSFLRNDNEELSNPLSSTHSSVDKVGEDCVGISAYSINSKSGEKISSPRISQSSHTSTNSRSDSPISPSYVQALEISSQMDSPVLRDETGNHLMQTQHSTHSSYSENIASPNLVESQIDNSLDIAGQESSPVYTQSLVNQKAEIDKQNSNMYLDDDDDDCDGVTLSPTTSEISALTTPSCLQSVESSNVSDSTDFSSSDEDTGAVESATTTTDKLSSVKGPSEASSSQTSEAATPLIHSTLGQLNMKLGHIYSSDGLHVLEETRELASSEIFPSNMDDNLFDEVSQGLLLQESHIQASYKIRPMKFDDYSECGLSGNIESKNATDLSIADGEDNISPTWKIGGQAFFTRESLKELGGSIQKNSPAWSVFQEKKFEPKGSFAFQSQNYDEQVNNTSEPSQSIKRSPSKQEESKKESDFFVEKASDNIIVEMDGVRLSDTSFDQDSDRNRRFFGRTHPRNSEDFAFANHPYTTDGCYSPPTGKSSSRIETKNLSPKAVQISKSHDENAHASNSYTMDPSALNKPSAKKLGHFSMSAPLNKDGKESNMMEPVKGEIEIDYKLDLNEYDRPSTPSRPRTRDKFCDRTSTVNNQNSPSSHSLSTRFGRMARKARKSVAAAKVGGAIASLRLPSSPRHLKCVDGADNHVLLNTKQRNKKASPHPRRASPNRHNNIQKVKAYQNARRKIYEQQGTHTNGS